MATNAGYTVYACLMRSRPIWQPFLKSEERYLDKQAGRQLRHEIYEQGDSATLRVDRKISWPETIVTVFS